jgi:hypothetical protein
MTVTLLTPRRPRPAPAATRTPMHSEYPIAQTFHSDDPAAQRQLMQRARRPVIEPEPAVVLTECNGLRALARSEAVLNRVAGTLRRRFGAALVAGPPEVRYFDGDPMLEPYMTVLVHAPAVHLARVCNDLLARRGRVTRVVERSMFVLEGEAPLAHLLGYYDRVHDMLAEDRNQSHVATWLSRYAPMEGGGPEAA